MNPKFSIIVPTLDNFDEFLELVSAINLQTLPPKEIVVADSSSSDEIETSIQNISSSIPLLYVRVGRAYKYDRFLHRIFSFPFLSMYKEKFPRGRAFPYEATNAGAAAASFELLAFLDATTIPKDNWLKDYYNFMQIYKCDVVFGKTKYFATTKFQKLLRASTYGRMGHETAPGTIMTKKNFLNKNKIKEGVRSGGDVEWKIRIKSKLKYYLPENNYLSYSNLPLGLLPALKKFFIYQIHGSFLDIQNNVKDLYMGLSLILCLIIGQKWNHIVGWDSVFFIPHVTKIFLVSIIFIISITFFINRGLLRKRSKFDSNKYNFLKLTIFLLVSFSIFRWNAAIANWVEESVWYIPHITKIFIAVIFGASFFYRGIYFPLKHDIEIEYLFPYRWIGVGLLGILLDVIKAPGYLLGAVLASVVKRAEHKN